MRATRLLIAAGLAFGLAGPALAQGGVTQTPPAPNAASASPQSPNDLPAGALTANPSAPGGNSPTMGAQTGMGGMPPAAGPSGSSGNNPSGAFSRTVPQPR